MTAFDNAWNFLKADESYTGKPKFSINQKDPIEMHEYPKGSGNFMSLEEMIHTRNANSRQNMSEDASHAPTQEELEAEDEWMRNNFDSFNRRRNNTMANSETGGLSQEELEAHPDFGKTWFPNGEGNGYVPKDYTGNTMVNSETGNYDPNDPEGWHPMGEPELPEGWTMGQYLEREREKNPQHWRR